MVCITGCFGSGSENGGPPKPFDPTVFVGTYNGTWHNQTFNTSGPMKFVVTDDTMAKTMAIVVTLGGNVFGGQAPPPFTLTGNYTSAGFTMDQQTNNFGRLHVTIDGNGNMNGTGTNIPGGVVSSVSFSGLMSATQFQGNYTANLSSGSTANGTMTATKS